MAESICRALRDGALEGEHAPALMIKDSVCSPFGFDVFIHVLTQLSSDIVAGKSQSRGLLLVIFSRSPMLYVDLLRNRGMDLASSHKRVHILDCYTDPVGWKDRLKKCGNIRNLSKEASTIVSLCKDVRDLDKFFSSIIELGKGLVPEGKDRFSVAIDSVSELLRHASMPLVAGLLSDIRSHEKISSAFWRLLSDHLDIRETAAFEYLSSIVANLEPINHSTKRPGNDLEKLSLLEQNPKGKFWVRFKRRNGRVRVMCERFHFEQSGIKFVCASSQDKTVDQEFLPKVQFNLQLSEKERMDRAKVVLPFEHQGNGNPIEIYDGRRSLTDSKDETPTSNEKLGTNEDSVKGEIIYFRDSEDELLDSDEDPDDDLDI